MSGNGLNLGAAPPQGAPTAPQQPATPPKLAAIVPALFVFDEKNTVTADTVKFLTKEEVEKRLKFLETAVISGDTGAEKTAREQERDSEKKLLEDWDSGKKYYDPSTQITEANVTGLSGSQIAARLDFLTKNQPLSKTEVEEKPQLELWKAQIDEATAPEAGKAAAAAEVAAKKAVFASITQWAVAPSGPDNKFNFVFDVNKEVTAGTIKLLTAEEAHKRRVYLFELNSLTPEQRKEATLLVDWLYNIPDKSSYSFAGTEYDNSISTEGFQKDGTLWDIEKYYNPNTPITAASVKNLTDSQIAARIKVLDPNSKKTPKDEEQLQLELYKATTEQQKLAGAAATPQEQADAAAKVNAAKDALNKLNAAPAPWDFSKAMPAPDAAAAAGDAPGADVESPDENSFKGEAPDATNHAHSVMGQMFENFIFAMQLTGVQFLFHYLVARPMGVIGSMVSGPLQTTLGLALKTIGYGLNIGTGTLYKAKWWHDKGNQLLENGDKADGTMAFFYKPLVSPILFVRGYVLGNEAAKKTAWEYINPYARLEDVKNSWIGKPIQLVTPPVVPKAIGIGGHLILGLPAFGVSAGLHGLSSGLRFVGANWAADKCDKGAVGSSSFSGSRFSDVLSILSGIAEKPFTNLLPMPLTGGAKDGENAFYKKCADFDNAADPEKSWFAVNHNFVRWMSESSSRTAGPDNSPVGGVTPLYFKDRSDKLKEIERAIDSSEKLSADAKKSLIENLNKTLHTAAPKIKSMDALLSDIKSGDVDFKELESQIDRLSSDKVREKFRGSALNRAAWVAGVVIASPLIMVLAPFAGIYVLGKLMVGSGGSKASVETKVGGAFVEPPRPESNPVVGTFEKPKLSQQSTLTESQGGVLNSSSTQSQVPETQGGVLNSSSTQSQVRKTQGGDLKQNEPIRESLVARIIAAFKNLGRVFTGREMAPRNNQSARGSFTPQRQLSNKQGTGATFPPPLTTVEPTPLTTVEPNTTPPESQKKPGGGNTL
jgi:hypothetical protein